MPPNILHDLYNGKINPMGRDYKMSEAVWRLHMRKEEETEYFASILPPKEQERFRKLERLYQQANLQGEYDAFSCGFSLGAQLMLAILTTDCSLSTE